MANRLEVYRRAATLLHWAATDLAQTYTGEAKSSIRALRDHIETHRDVLPEDLYVELKEDCELALPPLIHHDPDSIETAGSCIASGFSKLMPLLEEEEKAQARLLERLATDRCLPGTDRIHDLG